MVTQTAVVGEFGDRFDTGLSALIFYRQKDLAALY